VKRIDRYNLIQAIAVRLQQDMVTTDINVFIGGFGVEHEEVNIVPSKRVYVAELLADESDGKILQIARELDIEVPKSSSAASATLCDYLQNGGYEAAAHDFNRALEYVETDAEQALGSASSTLESLSKAILDKFDEPCPKDESLAPIVRLVFKKMDLSPEAHADPDIKRVLGGLLNSALGIGVLRTKYSGFHGKSGEQKRKRLSGRHARLAVNAAATVGLFLVETYLERFASREQ